MEENEGFSETVIKMRKYIDEHLSEPITAKELARAAGYSQYHMIRIFKKETGLSPFEYIRQRRLISSAFELRRRKFKVVDVALNFVFDSQEGFTRAFSNGFGISPKRFAKMPEVYGYVFDEEAAPRFQLAPMGWRGYIEGRPIKEIQKD